VVNCSFYRRIPHEPSSVPEAEVEVSSRITACAVVKEIDSPTTVAREYVDFRKDFQGFQSARIAIEIGGNMLLGTRVHL
jgi:hypothetical protein